MSKKFLVTNVRITFRPSHGYYEVEFVAKGKRGWWHETTYTNKQAAIKSANRLIGKFITW